MNYPAKGARNIYTCDTCHNHIVTQDVDQGVTPFMIGCTNKAEACKGMMKSSMYRVFDQSMKAGWEWYRPHSVQLLSLAEREHVARGGLLMREATKYLPGPDPFAARAVAS